MGCILDTDLLAQQGPGKVVLLGKTYVTITVLWRHFICSFLFHNIYIIYVTQVFNIPMSARDTLASWGQAKKKRHQLKPQNLSSEGTRKEKEIKEKREGLGINSRLTKSATLFTYPDVLLQNARLPWLRSEILSLLRQRLCLCCFSQLWARREREVICPRVSTGGYQGGKVVRIPRCPNRKNSFIGP